MIDCSICLESKENFKTLRCGHQFCNECINKLIEHNTFKNCPICRTSIIPETENQPVLINNFFNNRVLPILNEEIQEINYQVERNNRQNRRRNQQLGCELNNNQECYCSLICAFIGFISIIIIVFIEVGIIK